MEPTEGQAMGQKNASLKDGIGLMERENEQRKRMLLGYIKHREEMSPMQRVNGNKS